MSLVWIVDDEPAICYALRKSLVAEGQEVRVFSDAESVLTSLAEDVEFPDAVMLDIRLPGMNGLETLQHIHAAHADLPVIIMTAFGDLRTAVTAIQGKAFEYLTKPFDLDNALQMVRRALAQRTINTAEADQALAGQLEQDLILGSSLAMQTVYKQIAIAASHDATVLIEGERGTGKSLVAAMVHRFSSRAALPLLSIYPELERPSEYEVELFGSKSGEVSPGTLLRSGLMELAGKGTLIIEEIGALPSNTQLKIVHALETRSYVALLDSQTRELGARLLFTSTQPLDRLVSDEDLIDQLRSYLEVYRIVLPPLRERREDIAAMAQAFVRMFARDTELRLSQSAIRELERRAWAGNVRELLQTIQRAVLTASGSIIQIEDLPQEELSGDQAHQAKSTVATSLIRDAVRKWFHEKTSLKADHTMDLSPSTLELSGLMHEELLAVVEPPLIMEALQKLNGNRAAVAALLGLHRSTLRQKMKRYGID